MLHFDALLTICLANNNRFMGSSENRRVSSGRSRGMELEREASWRTCRSAPQPQATCIFRRGAFSPAPTKGESSIEKKNEKPAQCVYISSIWGAPIYNRLNKQKQRASLVDIPKIWESNPTFECGMAEEALAVTINDCCVEFPTGAGVSTPGSSSTRQTTEKMIEKPAQRAPFPSPQRARLTNLLGKPLFLSPHKKPPVSPPQPLESKLISVRDMTLEALANTTTYDKCVVPINAGVSTKQKSSTELTSECFPCLSEEDGGETMFYGEHIVLGVNKMITIVVGGLFGDDEEEEKTAEEVDTMQAVVGPLQAHDVIVVVVAVGSQNEAKPSHVDVEIGMKELKHAAPQPRATSSYASMFSKALTGCNAMMSRTSVMTSLAAAKAQVAALASCCTKPREMRLSADSMV
eukprot:gene12866-16089_t